MFHSINNLVSESGSESKMEISEKWGKKLAFPLLLYLCSEDASIQPPPPFHFPWITNHHLSWNGADSVARCRGGVGAPLDSDSSDSIHQQSAAQTGFDLSDKFCFDFSCPSAIRRRRAVLRVGGRRHRRGRHQHLHRLPGNHEEHLRRPDRVEMSGTVRGRGKRPDQSCGRRRALPPQVHQGSR